MRVVWNTAALVVALIVTMPGAAGSQAPVDALGPRVGAVVPEFAGTDQFGRRQSLQSIMGPRGAMLVFYRSADW